MKYPIKLFNSILLAHYTGNFTLSKKDSFLFLDNNNFSVLCGKLYKVAVESRDKTPCSTYLIIVSLKS